MTERNEKYVIFRKRLSRFEYHIWMCAMYTGYGDA